MPTPFIHDDFMLQTAQAKELYHTYAKDMPIIDYHCHLPPQEVADDKRWENIAQIWLGGDHYKWRALRSNGVDERFITGDAPDREKFQKWAESMPYMLRNPLYHWTHLELARYFGIDDKLLSGETADEIWTRANEAMQSPDFSCRALMTRSNVKLVCTTDDPTDTLEHHQAVAASGFAVQMLPTWRPDKGFRVDDPAFFNAWIGKLEAASGMAVDSFETMLGALQARHDFFHAQGCRLSDYGVDTVYADAYTDADIARIFDTVRAGKGVSFEDVRKWRSCVHYECGKMDHASGWTWQLHYGALRNNNSRLFKTLGPDTGFDSIGDWPVAEGMSRLFDRLDTEAKLPKTVIYNLNPRDNAVIGAMLGNFQDGSVPGKMQFGSGWWFLDQKDGMERQMETLSQLGLLSRFVGMLTDSRSFLSYTRHEYFRRILCNLLGNDMALGLIPDDMPLVGQMVKDISYNNAAEYFGFGLPRC